MFEQVAPTNLLFPQSLGRRRAGHFVGGIESREYGGDHRQPHSHYEIYEYNMGFHGPAKGAPIDDIDQDQRNPQTQRDGDYSGHEADETGLGGDQPVEFGRGETDRAHDLLRRLRELLR